MKISTKSLNALNSILNNKNANFLLSLKGFKRLTFTLIVTFASIMFGYSQPTTPTAPLGAGTVANPYQISSLDNLYWIFWYRAYGSYNKVYVQTANINASATSTWNSGQGWIPIGHDDLNIFMGSYDGGGYTISGLYINNASRDYVGLFGYIGYNTIKRVYLTSVNIKGRHYVGALAGKANFSSTIEQCYSTGTVTGNTTTGGLIGAVNGDSGMPSTVFKCYSSTTVNIDQVGGGLIGSVSSSTVSNCFSQGNVVRISGGIGTTNAGFVSTISGGSIQYCYSTGSVTYTGTTSPTNRGFVGSSSGTPTFTSNLYDSQTSAQSTGTGATAKTTAEMKTLSTFTSVGWDFLVETANGTNNYWGLDPNGNNGYPFLAWQPGLTHISAPTVSTQAVTSISYTTATANGNITNLGYPNPTQHGHCWSTTTNPTVANSKNGKGTASSTGAYTSALTGLNPNTTYYVRSYATNFTGTVYGTQVSFTTPQYFSGGAGTSVDPYLITTLADLQFLSENSSFWNKHYKQTANINASGTSTWNSGLGWIPIGNATTKFTGTYDGNGKTISGLTANRPSEHYVGFFGFIQGATVVVKNLGIISVNFTGNNYVGAIVGAIGTSASVTGCYSSGVVYGFNNAGGMVGYLTSGRVANSYNWASVIRRSGSSGTVFGSFAGYVSATIEYCYTTGGVSVIDGTNLTGKGFAGNTAGSPVFTSNFFNTSTTSQSTATGATGKTTAEMKSQITYTGWDFMSETTNGTNDYWGINPAANNGYPFLSWQGFTHISNVAPTVTTQGVSNAAATTATGNGNITSLGTPNPTQHGHCWSLSTNPTTSNFKTEKGTASSTGAFTSAITNLIPNTTYYVKAYATNTVGTSYGSEVSFTSIRKSIIIAGSYSVHDKIYDGNKLATIATSSLAIEGILSEYPNVSLTNIVLEFDSKNVSENQIPVRIASAELTGSDASKYIISLEGAPTSSARINAKNLTVINAIAQNKVYDGNTNSTITSASLSGVIGGDNVTLTNHTTGVFASKNVANGINVSTAMTLIGSDAGNYLLNQPSGLSANISQKELTISGLIASNKVYDGNSDANISGGILVGIIGEDNVLTTMPTTGTFGQSNVGTNIPVIVPLITLLGTDSGNYLLTQPSGITANITTKNLSISGLVASSKVYDGNNTANLIGGSLVGVIGSDNVTTTMPTSGTFAQSNVGNNIPVTIPTIILSGTAAGNYTLSQPTGIIANITVKTLTISGLSASSKVYDGNANATLTGGNLVGVVGENNVTANMPTTGTFAQSNVGSSILVSIPSVILSGTAAGNYTLTQPSGITASITAKTLTISGLDASNKVYDGNTNAILSGGTLVGVVGGDNVTATMPNSGTFAQSNVGNSISVSIPTIILTGTMVNNYTLTQPTGITANITAKMLSVSGLVASSKVYDGNTSASLSGGSLMGIIGGDNVTATMPTIGTFSQATPGSGITILVPTISLSGTKASNYSLTQPVGLTATIFAKQLTIGGSFTVSSKVYNGSTNASISSNSLVLNGVVNSDMVSLVGISVMFVGSGAGNGIQVNIVSASLEGTNMSNYTLSLVNAPISFGNIAKAPLTVINAVAQNKVYDGTIAATISGALLSGILGEDIVALNNHTVGYFSQATIGTSIGITTNMSLAGASHENYELIQPSLSANITKRPLIITANSFNKSIGTTYEFNGNEFTSTNLVYVDLVSSVSLSSEGANINAGVGNYPIVPTNALGVGLTNYNISYVNGILTVVDQIEVTLTGISVFEKMYDGLASATVSSWGTLQGVAEGDNVILDYTDAHANFVNKNVGTDKLVTISGLALTGTDAGKYYINNHTSTANITSRNLTLTNFYVTDKVYDGNVGVSNSSFDDDRINGDLLEFSYSVEFENRNTGVNKNVYFTNVVISGGADKQNYILASNFGSAIASIQSKELQIGGSFSVLDKDYDGNTSATLDVDNLFLIGIIGNDEVNLVPVVRFIDSNIGTDKMVILTDESSLDGNDSSNYILSLTGSPTSKASIFEATVEKFSLTLLVNPLGAANVSGSGIFEEGEEILIEATANNGFVFDSWTQGSSIISTSASFTFTMPSQDVTLTANFLQTYGVTFTILSGSSPVVGASISINELEITSNSEGLATINLPNGTYSFKVSADGYIDATGSIVVYSDAVSETVNLVAVGIDNTSLSNVIVYPNPFRNTIYLENLQGLKRIVIIDITGKIVFSRQVEEVFNYTIDIDLAYGVYLLNLIGDDGKKVVRRMVRE
jgi:hypothetical protein